MCRDRAKFRLGGSQTLGVKVIVGKEPGGKREFWTRAFQSLNAHESTADLVKMQILFQLVSGWI